MGRYNPVTDVWTATSLINVPTHRGAHTAVWTGSEMIVWGGSNGFNVYFNTGGRYDPDTDSWTATSTSNAPAGRVWYTAVWTGNEMILGRVSFRCEHGREILRAIRCANAYTNTNGNYNSDAHIDADCDTNSHGNGDSHAYFNLNTDTEADAHAEVSAYTQAASCARTAPVAWH